MRYFEWVNILMSLDSYEFVYDEFDFLFCFVVNVIVKLENRDRWWLIVNFLYKYDNLFLMW